MSYGDVVLLLSGVNARSGGDMLPTHKGTMGVTHELAPTKRYNTEYTANGTPPEAFTIRGIWASHALTGGWGVQLDLDFYLSGYYVRVSNGATHIVDRIYSHFGTSIKYVLGRYISTTPAVTLYFWVEIDGSKMPPAGIPIQTITYNIYDARDKDSLCTELCTGAVTAYAPATGYTWWPSYHFPKGGFDLLTAYGIRALPTSPTSFGFVAGGTTGAYYVDVTIYNAAGTGHTQRINLDTVYVEYVLVSPVDRTYGAVFRVDSALLAEQLNPLFSAGTDMRGTYVGGVATVASDQRYSPPLYSEYYALGIVKFLYYIYNTRAYDVPVTVSYLTSLDASTLTGYDSPTNDSDAWWFYTTYTTDMNLTADLSTASYLLIDTSDDTGTFTVPANSYMKVEHRIRLGTVPAAGTTGLSGFKLL